jgi:hypothetical protein
MGKVSHNNEAVGDGEQCRGDGIGGVKGLRWGVGGTKKLPVFERCVAINQA